MTPVGAWPRRVHWLDTSSPPPANPGAAPSAGAVAIRFFAGAAAELVCKPLLLLSFSIASLLLCTLVPAGATHVNDHVVTLSLSIEILLLLRGKHHEAGVAHTDRRVPWRS